MNAALKQIRLIKRIDRLIRLKATGSPIEFASKLDISKATLHRTILAMKELDAPIIFDIKSNSYLYLNEVIFKFGFHANTSSDYNLDTKPRYKRKKIKKNIPVPKNETGMF
ncbi:hypothetical protein FOF46_30805 [Aquimarina algiphila]|uniref:HTH domain-containing protein n=1 Tax=Aquimarina algiphila TaxID=2047982 RepID=A0A554VA12_9FLAO|nr:hypothetical protein [Aquimarina algiphila]TSE02496.1 hypothetical protein FOF46_30805 [Aquimarina algiphila]